MDPLISSPRAAVALTGEVARPALLTVDDLVDSAAWPVHHAEVTFLCSTSGARRHRFSGPALHDVVLSAAPAFPSGRRKDRTRFLLVVAGADGHVAVLSWAEIDPDFAGSAVLLATHADGSSLAGPGPQLVVPGDRYGARCVSRVGRVGVHRAGADTGDQGERRGPATTSPIGRRAS
ncbi:hypothetical protein [Streptomyces radicis]|uniref:hypothetical protein n=1 Tax=Streptomyces radicis TaxID=1750517 RepID=UPI001E6216AB|nr:hypothetical protein [Streptomyces radicis]